MQWRIAFDEDRFGAASRRLGADVHEARAARLREDWRRRARVAEVDAVRVQRFEQLRSRREFEPLDAVAERFEFFVERALRLEYRKQARFLIADAWYPG